ncbi:MAG: isoprenylcysteine carboxylmethyltransferase family protein [Pseudomonadales bacterium]|nr:isoprenylcysteine carboxylmethyltransferase family protein [Pseudomonadales bacterium]
MNKRVLFIFGIFSYLLFLFCTLFTMGFLNNQWVPVGIDQGVELANDMSLLSAILINLGLVTLFGFSHSLLARNSVKQFLSGWLPQASLRSLYVFQSSAILIGICLAWQALPSVIWEIHNPLLKGIIWGIQGGGWLLVVWATFAINHFELTGLQQVYFNMTCREEPSPKFVTPWLYRIVRHPMQTGILIAFWMTPIMSLGHLIFAGTMTLYILIGIRFEERSLVVQFGDAYRDYQKQVPMLLPRLLNPVCEPQQSPRSDSLY